MSGRIRPARHEATDDELRKRLAPEVARWFFGTFGTATPPQRLAVPAIQDGRNVLVSSPTGTGKTLSAFLAILNDLVSRAAVGALEDRVHVVYVSPLKALNTDVARNLEGPLAGIVREFERAGRAPPAIRVAVRTGDTTPAARQSQTRRPPHILVTTPESLAIMLSAPRMKEHLARASYVIVDEIHAMAESKRGTHLALSLERLSAQAVRATGREPVRVGLSATISPLDDVARFLVGDRDCDLVDVSYLKLTDLEVVSPVADLVNTPWSEVQDELYGLLDGMIAAHRTTLVFTNSRSGTERVVMHLKERFGRKYAELDESRDPEFAAPDPDDRSFVAAHHGSLSKETRLDVEDRLKRGDLRCVVCSTSLELGIDIGYVDLVVLLGSPKGIARTLQRVGRSGHKLGATSKGRIVVLDRDDLVEAAVIVKEAAARRLDASQVPANALDVLAQHLVGMSLERDWPVDEAFATVRRAAPYATLTCEDFDATLAYLAGNVEALAHRAVYGKVRVVDGVLSRRGRMARAIYALNVGTIPDTTLAKVFEGERYVGQVEEEFVESLNAGDVFALAGSAWTYLYSRGMKVQVAPARGKRPTVPVWSGEKMPLSGGLAAAVRSFRATLAGRLARDDREGVKAFLREEHRLTDVAAEALARYVEEQARFAKVPDADEILVEEFVDDNLARTYVVHAVAGRRANEALARAFGRSLSRSRGVNVRVQVSDTGFALSVPRSVVLTLAEVKGLFHADLARELEAAIEGSEILKRRFRHVANRAFLVLRNYGHRDRSVGRQQVNSFILFHVLRKADPAFPVVREAYREVFEDAFDLPGAAALAWSVVTRATKVTLMRARKAPSPFAFNLVAMGAEDAVLVEDRARIIRELHERVMELIAEDAA